MRTLHACRYVLPLREGGSLPAIVEMDDAGLFVVKFRGAGQGPLALVAELLASMIGLALGLAIPEPVLVQLPFNFGRSEPDPEIRHLLKESVGLNFGLEYLPGAINFDIAANDSADADVASVTVWFDAFMQNVDRTARNPNLLLLRERLYLIDHGAALYFHHAGGAFCEKARSPFLAIRDHVLLPFASQIAPAGARARDLLTTDVLRSAIAAVPDEWLAHSEAEPISHAAQAAQRREQYFEYFSARLRDAAIFEEEAMRAHRNHV